MPAFEYRELKPTAEAEAIYFPACISRMSSDTRLLSGVK